MTSDMRLFCRHLSLALLALTIGVSVLGAQEPRPDRSGSAAFTVFLRGARVGSQTIDLSRVADGWLISSVGRLDAPLDLTTMKFEVSYDGEWQPRRLIIDARLRGEPFSLTTTFTPTAATSEVRQGTQQETRTARISPGTVVLPNSFFGAYEALAARLEGRSAGSSLPVFAVPDTEVTATIDRVTARRISTPDGTVEVQDFVLTLTGQTGPIPLEIWVDGRGRLARAVLPAAALAVVRDDLASVMSREEPVKNPGDQDVFVPANGFSLGATITQPASTPGKVGAVVLAASPGPQGREHMSYGVPIYGQLAGRLADAGFLVVRYDARGVGQSGGRTETAGVLEYAEDASAVVAWLRKRRDVDSNRVILLGYGEAGPIAMTAASRDKNIKGLALLAVPGRSGRDVTLEQQKHVLDALPMSESSKQEKIALQTRIVDAVMTGTGWNDLPAGLRPEVDSTWFRTWLQFQPEDVMRRIGQPLLIVHGTLDREVPAAHADLLDSLSRSRKTPPTFTTKTVMPGLNHLLVQAQTGEIDEYAALSSRAISQAVAEALVNWLTTVGAGR